MMLRATNIAVIARAIMIGRIAAAQSDELNPDAMQIAQVRQEHLAELMKIPHVVGVATELSDDGEIVLDVEVDQAQYVSDVERKAPSEVDGFPVDVDLVPSAKAGGSTYGSFSSISAGR